jgi:hypothetical protein
MLRQRFSSMDQVRISMPKIEGTFLPPSPKAIGKNTKQKRPKTLTAKPLPKKPSDLKSQDCA